MIPPLKAAAILAVVAAMGLWSPLLGIAEAEPSPEPPPPGPDGPFPYHDDLSGQVEFWTRVFSEWNLGEVAVHDMEYPSLVFEVAPLPGKAELPYTDEQRDFVDRLRETWEIILEDLEHKIDGGKPLSDDEKALALRITTEAGTDAYRNAYRRVRTQRGLREQFRRGIEISARYMDVFRGIFREAGLPEDLAYLPHVESSFQAEARSSAGAVGIWQFTRGTGRHFLIISSTLDERLDPVAATRGAARYFRKAFDLLGDWALAVTSYNHGIQGMERASELYGTDFPRIVREYRGRTFGFASRNFYAEFLAAREIAREPDLYFPEGIVPEPPLELDRVVLERKTSAGRIARTYRIELSDLVALNPGWTRRALRGGQALPAGAIIWLPAGTLAGGAGPSASPKEPDVDGSSHIVRPGETLSSIADRYGMDVSTLRRINGIPPEESLILVGERLLVKPDGAMATATPMMVHVVRPGDTLSGIAASYGVRLADVLTLNDLSATSVIHPGQQLLIPAE